MIKLLRRLFGLVKIEYSYRFVTKPPGMWTEEDKEQLASFLQSETGQKLTDHYCYTIHMNCMREAPEDQGHRDMRRGMVIFLNGLFRYASLDPVEDAQTFDETEEANEEHEPDEFDEILRGGVLY